MQISGAIFDFDGTLFDSMYVWNDFAANYLRSKGKLPQDNLDDDLIDMISLEEAAHYMRKVYELEDSAEDILRDIDGQIAHEYLYCIKSYPGVHEFLELLHQAKVPMAIASMTSAQHIRVALEREGLTHYFKVIYSVEDCSHGKRHPEVYDKALEYLAQFGAERESCLVFEDAVYAIKTVLQAQYPVIALTTAGNDLPVELRSQVKLCAPCITPQLYQEIQGLK